MIKISIIIPAYNASRSLRDTVESILQQSLREIEVIIVDDGSTDKTLSIARSLQIVDERVKVIAQKNRGAYAARRVGLLEAKGIFFGFVDADDKVKQNMYEELYSFAQRYTLDIAQCEHRPLSEGDRLFLNRESVVNNIIWPRMINGEDALFVWDKIYRKSSVKPHLEKSNIMMFDDLVMNMQFFHNVNRVGYLGKALYEYRINEGSSVRNFRLKNIEDFKEAVFWRKKLLPYYVCDDLINENDRWILKNTRSMYIVASAARAENGKERCSNVKRLLDSNVVYDVFKRRRMLWLLWVFRSRLAIGLVGCITKIRRKVNY